MILSKKSVLSVSLFILILWGVVLSTFANPPTSPYAVSQNITDPACAPSSLNCYVANISIGDTVGNSPDQNGILYTNATGQVTTDPLFTRDSVTKETNIAKDFNVAVTSVELTLSNVITIDPSDFSGPFFPGDSLVGATSGATATLDYYNPANGFAYLSNVVGSFQNGEVINDITAGESSIVGQSFPITPFAVNDTIKLYSMSSSSIVAYGTVTAVSGNVYTVQIQSATGVPVQYDIALDNLSGTTKFLGIINFTVLPSGSITTQGTVHVGSILGGLASGVANYYGDQINNRFALNFVGTGFGTGDTYSSGTIVADVAKNNFATIIQDLYSDIDGTPELQLSTIDASNGYNSNIVMNGNRMILQNNQVIALLGRIQIGNFDYNNDTPSDPYPAFPDYYYLPSARGSAGQVLTDDGNGNTFWQTLAGSGWSLTGNAGTTAGTNFIGTTDATDFMVKTNGNQIALFGQNSNIAFGSSSTASALYSFAGPGSTASSFAAVALGGGTASANRAIAIGSGSTASGATSVALGDTNIASGDSSIALGVFAHSYSFGEIGLGTSNSVYIPIDTSGMNLFDRLLTVGNGGGVGSEHNAYTLWKDGSFAYNDDNFQNDNVGTEQNMFYFNYGNHDGNGNPNSKRAIRLGSAENDKWDITSGNVGDRSIALGFGPYTSIASGDSSIAIGNRANAIGNYSNAFGTLARATGDYSFAFGDTNASGRFSVSFADSNGLLPGAGGAQSAYEFALGGETTSYIPNDSLNWDPSDRLFVIGKGIGGGSGQDAVTILKNGQTGIGISQFQANTNGNIFQVGDGTTGIIGYVDNGTGNWVAVSDERKKDNITDLTYGLDTINKLHPVSFDYNRNNEHTIGFLAQEVKDIIPEAVFGSEEKGYGMSYATLTPALVSAIQEMNVKVTNLTNPKDPSSIVEKIIAKLIKADRIETKELCVDDICVTRDQFLQMVQTSGSTPTPATSPILPDPLICTAPQVLNQTGDACVDPVAETPEEIPTVEEPSTPTE